MAQKAFASSTDLADKEQSLEVLADGVYALTAEGDPNVGAIEGEDFLVCFEAMATPVAARQWLARLRSHTDKPVRYLVLSHYHAVRVLGASAFDAGVIVTHENTRTLIAERGLQDWASELARMPRLFKEPASIPGLTWPTATFSDRFTIDLGGDRGECVLAYCGRGHTDGDIVAWLPRQRILFAGDLVEAQAALYTGDAYHREWSVSTLDRVASLGAGTLVGGRGAVTHGESGRHECHCADPQLPAGDAARGGFRTAARRHAQGGLRRHSHRTRGPLRRLADLRALPAVRRVSALGRTVRHRQTTHLDGGTGPRSMGPVTGLKP